ncbi:hypothetical protein FE783_04815 [Paenibacillus mesophilus]|uniref:phosphodiester glycosidase family protein n=1 Tax=Paenibacillus mesophilus TaxID=2582849 RepID=UPI00110EFFB1|nr:phosphodiester glycosidase family protein [Paenibacillus mesophilus]TMV52266.1 hypothetical protein FE783_04815 [Paenibacillus mesophilus]
MNQYGERELFGMAKAQQAVNWAVKQEETYRVAPGVVHTIRQLAGRDMVQTIQMTEIDATNPYLQLEAFSSNGTVTGLETVGGMLRQLEAQGKRIVGGFNGDFFSYAGVPSGLQITNGEVVTSPSVTKVLMAVMPDGTVIIRESVEMSMLLTTSCGSCIGLHMINRAQSPAFADHAWIYNNRFGKSTRTAEGTVEAVITVSEGNGLFIAGKRITGTVDQAGIGSGTPIENGKLVISATGTKAQWVAEYLVPGTQVQLDLSFGSEIDRARQVISGSSTLGCVLLRDSEVPHRLLDPAVRQNSDRHPRTMIGVKGGKLYLFAVDGRQPGHSDGVTMAESAYYLQSIGMEQAINVDGGGSTTCYIRPPGDDRSVLSNRPSDGFERLVGNTLALWSTAPLRSLEELVLLPGRTVKVMCGSNVSFSVKGRDAFGNNVPIRQEQLEWKVSGNIGKVDPTGGFLAGAVKGIGQIAVRCGTVTQTCTIIVEDRAASLQIEPSSVVMMPGGNVNFRAFAYDLKGERVRIDVEQLTWSVQGGIGEVAAAGTFHASESMLQGKVIVRHGEAMTEADVRIGILPHLITGFESLDGMLVTESNAVPGSVALSRTARPQPVRYGTFSAKLAYDFTGMKGVSEAGIRFMGQSDDAGYSIEGTPYRLSVWVFGDAKRHMLQLQITDASGRRQSVNATEDEGVYWKGWKYVYADIPVNIVYPIQVNKLSVVETDEANKGDGIVYFDNFRAEYMDLNEDVEGPAIDRLTPAPNTSHRAGSRLVISAVVTDAGSGVQPASIRMWLNGVVMDHRYDAVTGKVEFVPESDWEDGEYNFVIEAADNNGTAAVPPAGWTFRIGGTGIDG